MFVLQSPCCYAHPPSRPVRVTRRVRFTASEGASCGACRKHVSKTGSFFTRTLSATYAKLIESSPHTIHRRRQANRNDDEDRRGVIAH